MRLLFINRYFYPDHSATAQMLTELVEDLDASGERVTVIAGRRLYQGGDTLLPAYESYKGIRIRRVVACNFGRNRFWGRLADYLSFYASAFWTALRVEKPDSLVVMSDPPLLSILAVLFRMARRVKTVCWLQDIYPDIAVQAGAIRDGVFARILRGLSLWSLRKMDRIVVIGRCMDTHLRRTGIPGDRIVTVPNWADGMLIHPLDRVDNPFPDEGKLRDRFVVMYSGNLGVVHEFDTMAAMIRETRFLESLCFCFVGDGHQKRRLAEMAAREQWGHVALIPYQPKERLGVSLAAGDVHLVTLRDEMKGLCVPSKIYGILAAGRPVIFIGPEDSEVADVLREAGCGVVVAPGDVQGGVQALLSYYRDRSLLEAHGHAARTYFERRCDRSLATQRFRQVLHDI